MKLLEDVNKIFWKRGCRTVKQKLSSSAERQKLSNSQQEINRRNVSLQRYKAKNRPVKLNEQIFKNIENVSPLRRNCFDEVICVYINSYISAQVQRPIC